MQIQAIIDLKHLSAAETAQFEERCRAAGVTPEQKLAELIKADSRRRRVSAATDSAGRRATPRRTRKGKEAE